MKELVERAKALKMQATHFEAYGELDFEPIGRRKGRAAVEYEDALRKFLSNPTRYAKWGFKKNTGVERKGQTITVNLGNMSGERIQRFLDSLKSRGVKATSNSMDF